MVAGGGELVREALRIGGYLLDPLKGSVESGARHGGLNEQGSKDRSHNNSKPMIESDSCHP